MKVYNPVEILGKRVKDRVTGLTGVATSVTFDLYGCIQVILNPGIDSSGKLGEVSWFDIARLEVIAGERVMDLPNFKFPNVAEGGKGPEEKPVRF